MTQVLVGDSTDNYRGLPGAGPTFAETILEGLESPESMWGADVEAYRGKGFTEEDALVQARCARLLQTEDYRNGKVILWVP